MIRKILLASAAAVVSSSAYAADAIIAAEPEPVEYVRVCDAFGEGYFYIPGTETCLKIGGNARFRVYGSSAQTSFEPDNFEAARDAIALAIASPTAANIAAADAALAAIFSTSGGDSYSSFARARVTLDAKSDTELGELHAKLRLHGQTSGSTTSDFSVHQAYLQLGGLFAGYSESNWNYATNGGASGFGGKGIYDGNYEYQHRNMLQYQFNGANFFAAVSLEDDGDATSWTPDIVARIGGVVGGVTIFGVLGYDQRGNFDDDVTAAIVALDPDILDYGSQWGVKLGLNADVGAAGNFILQGFYASGPTAYGANQSFLGTTYTPEWSILASYGHQLTDTLEAHINGQYSSNYYSGLALDVTGAPGGDTDSWSISGGFSWTPVTNFTVAADVRYTSMELNSFDQLVTDAYGVETDWWNFAVQLQRSF